MAAESPRGGDPGWTATRLPASWRLPEPPRAKVEAPSIRLDADTEPRVTVTLPRRAFDVIEAACIRSGDLETGGWLSGHQPRNWHRDRAVLEATVAVRHSSTDSVDARYRRVRAVGRQDARRSPRRRRRLPRARRMAFTPGRRRDAERGRPRLLGAQARDDHRPRIESHHPDRRPPRPDRDSWRNPQITAWITRHARSSFGERMVCEPATVSVR